MIKKIISRPQSNWTKDEGLNNNIVISSRIRLARNLYKLTMPSFQKGADASLVLDKVKKAVDALELQNNELLYFYRLNELTDIEREILFEKHLISSEHREGKANKGLLINERESVSIMINEEDHIRIQTLFPGLQLDKAWEFADDIDDKLESQLEYAFDQKIGYLTSCPTNVGTGLRASVMVHLPALALTKQSGIVLNSLGQLGLTVRGLYGEGTESIGNLYQISNQVTLGQTETEIIQNLTTLTKEIVQKEEETRKWLLQENLLQLKNRVGRAFGILQNSAILNTQEALNYLSDVRMGIDLGIITNAISGNNLSELIVLAQPGFIQRNMETTLEPIERDAIRADLFAQKFRVGGAK